MTARWRVGRKVPINVYEGDRPVCQCQTAADARLIVTAVNDLIRWRESSTSGSPTRTPEVPA